MKTGNIDCTLRGHTSWVSSIQLSRDTIVSGSWDASLKVWKLKEDVDRNKEGGHVDGHNSDYTYDSYGSNSNHHHHKDRRRYITQGKPSPPSPPSSVYHSSQRKKLTGECVATLDGENGNVVYCHQWDVRTGIINAGCRQQVVKTWDINTQTVVRTYMGHVKQVYCLQFDDAKIVSGSEAIKVWDCKSGLCEMTLNEHSNPIMCVMFDDHKLVSGSYDKTIKVYHMCIPSAYARESVFMTRCANACK